MEVLLGVKEVVIDSKPGENSVMPPNCNVLMSLCFDCAVALY